MYSQNRMQRTSIKKNTSYEGERIEEKINRIVNNKEPITDGAPIVYTERKDGVRPEYDIRTDRFEIAVDAMDAVSKTHLAKREESIEKFSKKLDKANEKLNKGKDGNKDGGAESTQATEGK